MMNISGWGRYPQVSAQGHTFEIEEQLLPLLAQKETVIAFGNGRSYGDSALNEHVICTSRFDKILAFDAATGLVMCECGVTLADLIDAFLPRGFFLKITPGTKLITLGGAIASDVHGKNHHKAGCFSTCVDSLELLLPNGEIVECSRTTNGDLFRATCGGMGLTGVILRATIALIPVKSAYIRETIVACRNLEEICGQFEAFVDKTYSVAWIDCLARGEALGRSILMVGDHANDVPDLALRQGGMPAIPFDVPAFCLNRHTVSVFNALYYKQKAKKANTHLVHLDPFFYPLDAIAHWNRLYGRRGFTQYQLVLPKAAGVEGLKVILNRIASTGEGSFLAVLKLFGPENDNLLTFPMEGYTLAVDFKITPRIFDLLNELDRVVLDYGGRLYLSKDVRMSADMFQKGYPKLDRFVALLRQFEMIRKFNSLQSKRLGLHP